MSLLLRRSNQGSGGRCILYVDDQKVAEGQIPKTQPFVYSGDEGVDVGTDNELTQPATTKREIISLLE